MEPMPMVSCEEYDPYKGQPDAEERKAMDQARQRMSSVMYLLDNAWSLGHRELTANILHSMAAICDDLRACARACANKQMTLLKEEVAKPNPEW